MGLQADWIRIEQVSQNGSAEQQVVGSIDTLIIQTQLSAHPASISVDLIHSPSQTRNCSKSGNSTESTALVQNLIIGILLLLMIGSLVSAFWYMLKDRGASNRTVKALTVRISIWVLLFGLIVGGIYTGLITPSNTVPIPPKSSVTE